MKRVLSFAVLMSVFLGVLNAEESGGPTGVVINPWPGCWNYGTKRLCPRSDTVPCPAAFTVNVIGQECGVTTKFLGPSVQEIVPVGPGGSGYLINSLAPTVDLVCYKETPCVVNRKPNGQLECIVQGTAVDHEMVEIQLDICSPCDVAPLPPPPPGPPGPPVVIPIAIDG